MQNQTPPQSNQDAFNRVWQHFVVEKNPQSRQVVDKRRIGEAGTCLYRSKSENKVNGCAVGCMLPDKLYRPDLEGVDFKTLTAGNTGLKEWFNQCSSDLIQDLQYAHDRNTSGTFESGFREVAEHYKLTVPGSV